MVCHQLGSKDCSGTTTRKPLYGTEGLVLANFGKGLCVGASNNGEEQLNGLDFIVVYMCMTSVYTR